MLSIIVPVYNVESYLPMCIQSILNQTITEFEMILVDDGSTDGSASICDQYAEKDSRIRVIHKTNGGLSDARNVGLKAAKGRYIGFVDSDDFIREDMYEVLLRILEKEKADFIKSDYVDFFDNDKIEIKKSKYVVNVFTPSEAIADFIKTEFSNTKPMKSVVWDALYKREIFFDGEKLVVQFPVGKINEDTYIFPELIFRGKKILHVNEAFYYHRMRKNSITHSPVGLREIESCDLWEHIETVVTAHTNEYKALCIRNDLLRKFNILERIYYSECRKEYFDKCRRTLLLDEEKYKKYVTDKRLLRKLRLVRAYPLYLMIKKYI